MQYLEEIKLNCENTLPLLAQDQNVTTKEETEITITLSVINDNGQVLNYSLLTQPIHGILSGAAPQFTYTPNINYVGNDSFTFSVNDGNVDSQEATVLINVTAVNDTPVADEIQLITTENTFVSMLLNGSDIDGDMLSYHIVTQPIHGQLAGTGKNLTYTPTLDYYGIDSFTYVVNDGTGMTPKT